VKRLFPIFNAVIAIASGIIVLLGYFTNFLQFDKLRILILQVAVLLAGWAIIIGVWNLFSVHFQKFRQRGPGAVYSIVLLGFFVMTFAIIVLGYFLPYFSPYLKQFQDILLNGLMVPAEISLMAILSVTLLYASVRMLRWRTDLKTILFLVTALLVLVGVGPWPIQIPFVSDLLHSGIQVLATGGARGILIGVALGTLTTGLRILFGTDRPYGGK
jgi:hypothetical protein